MGNYFSYLYEIENYEKELVQNKENGTDKEPVFDNEKVSDIEIEKVCTNFLVPIKCKYRKPPELEWDYDGLDLISDVDYKEKYNKELKKFEILNDKYMLLLYKYNCILNKKND